MGAGYEKQEGQHDELYKAGVGLERVNKSPRTLSFKGALLLYCFAAFILSMSGWTPRIDLAVNNSTPFITTLLRIHLRFVLSAGSPGPELAGLDITLIPPLSSANAFSFFSSTRISSATLHLRSLMGHSPCVAYPSILFAFWFSPFPSSPSDGLVSLILLWSFSVTFRAWTYPPSPYFVFFFFLYSSLS